jgi:hypothetical protein
LENSPSVRKVSSVAWGLVVVEGLVLLGYGLVFSTGVDLVFHNGPASVYSDQALSDLTNATRLIGVLILMGGILILAIGFKAFKGGEKWAWYTIASLPIIGVLLSYVDYLGNGGFTSTVWASWFSFGLFPLVAVLISIRSFFSKERDSVS